MMTLSPGRWSSAWKAEPPYGTQRSMGAPKHLTTLRVDVVGCDGEPGLGFSDASAAVAIIAAANAPPTVNSTPRRMQWDMVSSSMSRTGFAPDGSNDGH